MADPYWERFCAPLAQRILDLIRVTGTGGAAARPFILEENIDEVLGNGRYRIGGVALAAKGRAVLTVGQRVHVLYRDGTRHLILTHKWKRGQGGGGIQVGRPVEVLFIATDPATGFVEVWFRNDQQVTNLGLRVPPAGGGLDADPVFVRWGIDQASFVVMTTTHTCYVYEVDRPGPGVVFGARPPGVSLLRIESPLDAGHVLYEQSETSTLTGETRFFTLGAWPVADWPDPVALSLAATLPITKTVLRTGAVVLTRLAIEGSETPNRRPTAVITDIALDADRHLILSIAIELDGQTPASVSGAAEHEVWTGDTIPGAEVDTAEPDPHMTVGVWGNHLIVLDTTAGTVLFRTCKATVLENVTAEVHRFQTIQTGGIDTEYGSSDGGAWYEDGPPKTQAWEGAAVAGAPAYAYADLVSGYGTTAADLVWGMRKPGITAYTFDDCESFPYLTLGASRFTTETFTSTTTTGSRWSAAGGFQSGIDESNCVRAGRAHRKIWQRVAYTFAGFYVPREPETPGLPILPGRVFVHVREVTKATEFDATGSVRHGVYLHDLHLDTITAIVPIAANDAGNQGVHLPTTPPRFFYALAPATSQVFTVLGFDGRFLYWFQLLPDAIAEINVTNIETGATSLVLTGGSAEAGEGLGGAVGLAPALKELLERRLQVLAPEVMYYPSDDPEIAPDARNIFVDAWTDVGLPTLDATEPDFPPPEPALAEMGAQHDLPEEVEPEDDVVVAVNRGPVNLVSFGAGIGPSWQVVRTPEIEGLAGSP